MKKYLVCVLLLFFLLPQKARCVSPDDFRRFTSSDSLYSSLPEGLEQEEVRSLTQEKSPSGAFRIIGETIWEWITLGLRPSLTFLSGLCTLMLFSSLFESVKNSFGGKMEGAFDFLFLLVLAYFSYDFFSRCVGEVSAYLEGANTFLYASLPVLTMLLSLSGAVGSGAVQGANLTFVLSLISTFSSGFLFPLLRSLFCFSFLEGAGEDRLSGVVRFFQKAGKVLCVFFFLLASTVLSLQNALAAAGDSLAMRTLRFAAGNFIPVVGPLVGESTKTLSASFQMVKTECGTVCLVGLLFVLLRPILALVLQKTILSLGATVGEVLGETRCKKFLTSLSKTMDLMLALVISHACYLIFAITLFLKTGGNLS